MGFYDAQDRTKKPEKVVSISKQSAEIKDPTMNGTTKFLGEIHIGDFIFKKESDGSLSLAISTGTDEEGS